MGYADRPRVHHAFSLDAQSRGVCLSFADRRHSHSDTDTDINAYGDANSNSYCHGNSNTNTSADSDAKACSYTTAASHTGPSAIRFRSHSLFDRVLVNQFTSLNNACSDRYLQEKYAFRGLASDRESPKKQPLNVGLSPEAPVWDAASVWAWTSALR